MVREEDRNTIDHDPAYTDHRDGWPGGRADRVLTKAALSIVLIMGALTLLAMFILLAHALSEGV
jgi:hypothetical protein